LVALLEVALELEKARAPRAEACGLPDLDSRIDQSMSAVQALHPTG